MSEDSTTVVEHELAELSPHAPWSALDRARLGSMLARARLEFYARSAPIVHPAVGTSECEVLVVKSGTVSVRDAARGEEGAGTPLMSLGAGALLPLELGQPPGTAQCVYVAAGETYCWRLGAEAARELLREPAVLDWLLQAAHRLRQGLRAAWTRDSGATRSAAQMMSLPLRGLVKGAPATVGPHASVGEAIAQMAERGVGSMLIAQEGKPVGILTESDALHRVLARRLDTGVAVSEVMTRSPHAIGASATVAEAALEMSARGIRHLPVIDDDGQLLGVVSERDLFRLQRAGFGYFAAPIEQADSVEALARAVEAVRDFGRSLFLNGMGAAALTAVMSALNDRVAWRVMKLTLAEQRPGASFCWLAFGSEGRHEQTFSTDQDNGIIFVAQGEDVEAERRHFLAFAERANDALDRCGFPLCKGDVMARNPQWCLTLDEWKGQFARWIRTPSPEALLNANIFFDFRALYGDCSLAEALRDHLFSLSRDNTIFLAMMVKNALDTAPPLGRLSRFATDGGEAKGTIDLKRQGARLFVDIGRILALAHGVRATNSAERLRLGGQKARRSPSAIEADVAAFHFLQTIRMRGQLMRDAASKLDPNRIDPYALNEIDQRVLLESLKQAQLLQERLKLDFRL